MIIVERIGTAADQAPDATPFRMELPSRIRAWFRNDDGSCVQCSIGMCGIWQQTPEASTLLWDTEYGHRVRGGSSPSRVEDYAERRKIPVYNVTGSGTWEWMQWAAATGRFAAIGAGSSHFQTLYGWDPRGTETLDDDRWYVCNNNSTGKIDEYTWQEFRRLHLASGQWVVVIDKPPPPANPRYFKWW